MDKRALLLIGLFFLAPPAVQPGLAATEGEHQPSVLTGVKELDKPVTYTETKISLGELVQKVAADTATRLVALPDVADEPVAVVVKEMRARELLEQVAELLDYHWSRRGRGKELRFEIYQDVASKQREERLRQAVLADIEKRFRHELARYLDVASLSQEQMQALWDEQRRRSQELQKLPPEQRQSALSSPEQMAWNRRASLIFPLWSPIARTQAVLLGRLTTQQWAMLMQEGELVFSSKPRRGELRLPDEMVQTFRASRPSLNPPEMYSPSDPETEKRTRDWQQEGQSEWAAATGYRVVIRLDTNRFERGGSLELGATAEPVLDRPGALYEAGFSLGYVLGATLHISAQAVDSARRQAEQTPERRAALEQDPVVGMKNKQRIATAARPRPMIGIPEAAWRWALRDLLPDLARAYGVQFISDAYWNHAPEVAIRAAATEPVPLCSLLDGPPTFTHRWDQHDNLIRLRSKTWFLDRPREVPLRMARRWKAHFDEHGALPLDEYLSMVSELSDAKLESLAEIGVQMGLPTDFRDLYLANTARKALRLYASLGATQRQSLWRGQALPIAQLLPSQQGQLLTVLQDLNRGRTPPLDLEQFVSGRFSLSSTPFTRVIAGRTGMVTVREEAVPPGAESGDAASSRPPLPHSAAGPDGARRYAITQLRFDYEFGPDKEEPIGLYYVALPPR